MTLHGINDLPDNVYDEINEIRNKMESFFVNLVIEYDSSLVLNSLSAEIITLISLLKNLVVTHNGEPLFEQFIELLELNYQIISKENSLED